MKRGMCNGDKCIASKRGKPIKILGISSSKRAANECAREDPISLAYLKLSLEEAKRAGAEIQLIDLRGLKINPCKECYSTNPAQCRYNEKAFQCDCYWLKSDYMFTKNGKMFPIEQAYDKFSKKEFFKTYNNHLTFGEKDEMWKVYKAMVEADGVIFATSTSYYSRPALLQTMFSRLCALDGGVEKLWGDGKNLSNSIKFSKNPKAKYKQRLYGKFCAFINISKEGDSVTPDLMKACIMMGMKTIPLGIAYRVNWYDDVTHRSDAKNSMKDKYSLSLVKHIGKEIVKEVKASSRRYGRYLKTV